MTPRKLSLKTERLAELTNDDLSQVAAGAWTQQSIICTLTCPSWQNCTTAMSCGCEPSWNCQ